MQVPWGSAFTVHKLSKADLQPMVDVVADRLPTWKGQLMSWSGQTVLIKVTLSAIPIHTSITIKVSPWICRAIDKLRAFI
jgi:hypothetical protein